MIKPEDNGGTNAAETLSNRPNQTLISTQTITHEYLTLSGKVTRETVKKNGNVTDVMDFVYDESGRPFALNHSANGGSSFTTYYYILNLQGDVVKLVTASGSAVATYEYDAWGKVLSATGSMADKNPLRYRGYYYDNETGFYYLRSRYYDPANRRFINADSYASTGQGFIGTNMFAYCNNNPVMYVDPAGKSIIGIIIAVVAGIGLAVGLSGCGDTNPYLDAPSDFVYYPKEARRDGYQTMPNCYGYVWGTCNFLDPGTMALSCGILFTPRMEGKDRRYNRDTMIAAVLADGEAYGRTVRPLTSPTDIREDEQLVVCKIYDEGTNYHFAMQLSDGSWADKFGSGASRWNEIDGLADTWTIEDDAQTWVFDSASIYFAFGKTTGGY